MPPKPYILELENSMVFYMTPPGQENEQYLKSGLYNNVSEPELIYYFPKYLYSGEMFISKDGKYIVDILYWVAKTNQNTLDDETLEPALSFYKNGVLSKSYNVNDLLKDTSKGFYTISHIQWDYQDMRKMNDDENEFSTQTRDNVTLKFDLETGEIQSDTSVTIKVFVSIALCLLLCVVIFFITRKRLKCTV